MAAHKHARSHSQARCPPHPHPHPHPNHRHVHRHRHRHRHQLQWATTRVQRSVSFGRQPQPVTASPQPIEVLRAARSRAEFPCNYYNGAACPVVVGAGAGQDMGINCRHAHVRSHWTWRCDSSCDCKHARDRHVTSRAVGEGTRAEHRLPHGWAIGTLRVARHPTARTGPRPGFPMTSNTDVDNDIVIVYA